MGQIVQAQCEKCGFQKEILVGGGLRDCEWETILGVLPEEGKRALERAVQDGAKQVSVTRRIYACPSCKMVYALPVVSYTMNDRRQELYGFCPQCGKAGGSAGEDAVFCCPVCEGELILRQTGHWD